MANLPLLYTPPTFNVNHLQEFSRVTAFLKDYKLHKVKRYKELLS